METVSFPIYISLSDSLQLSSVFRGVCLILPGHSSWCRSKRIKDSNKFHFIWGNFGSQVFALNLLVLQVFLLCSWWGAGIVAWGEEARVWEGHSTHKGERVCSYCISCGMAGFPNSSFHWVIHEFRRGTVSSLLSDILLGRWTEKLEKKNVFNTDCCVCVSSVSFKKLIKFFMKKCRMIF